MPSTSPNFAMVPQGERAREATPPPRHDFFTGSFTGDDDERPAIQLKSSRASLPFGKYDRFVLLNHPTPWRHAHQILAKSPCRPRPALKRLAPATPSSISASRPLYHS